MIGPVSTTGRAMMASLQQAIDKGMPPDQAIQYVKGMATQGIAPLADLYSMMNQFQRLRQQQVQAPQTPPTIKDELDMMDQQQQMQAQAPMAQQGNIQQMQAPAPMAQPMDQGLGAIDAGQMEYPQFAGGGIVAFDEGGPVGLDLDKMSSEQLKILAADQDLDLAKAATRKLLQRSGYAAPQDYLDKYVSAVRSGIAELSQGPLIRFDSRKFPAHMYDEQGNVRRSTGTLAGIGGVVEVPASSEMVRRIDPQAGKKFAAAQEGFRQLMPREEVEAKAVPVETAQSAAPTAGAPVDMMGSMFSAENPFATPEERMRDMMRLMSTTRTTEAPKAEEAPRAPAQRGQARTGTGRAAAPKGDEFTKFERELPDLEKMRAERIERERANKTGRFSQADEEMAAFIKEQKEQYGASEKEARNNFWINAGASLMANNNPSFLAALGESVKDNYGNLVNDLKSLRKDQQALRLQEIQLQRAREQAIESGEEKDVARYERVYENAQSINLRITETRAEIREKIANRASQERIASMRAAGDEDSASQMLAKWRDAYGETDPAKRDQKIKAYEAELYERGRIRSAMTAGGAESGTRERLAIAEAVAKRKEKRDYTMLERKLQNAKTEQEKATIQAEMNRIEQAEINNVSRILSGGSNTGYVPTTGGMGGAGGTTTFSGW